MPRQGVWVWVWKGGCKCSNPLSKIWLTDLKGFLICLFPLSNQPLFRPGPFKIVPFWHMNCCTLSNPNKVVEVLWLLKLT
jgi:hypothetical protein